MQKFITLLFFAAIIFSSCKTKTIILSETDLKSKKETINKLLNDWHKAATDANLEDYFGKMSDDAVYLGTDAAEHWTKAEFYKFCKPYFDKRSAWEFTAKSRHIYFNEDYKTAWFDEVLDTWMGDCRGSGVLIYKENEWKIKHYNLAVAVPNDIIQNYIKLLKK